MTALRWLAILAVAGASVAPSRAAPIRARAAFDSSRVAAGEVLTYTVTLAGTDLPRLRSAPAPGFGDFRVLGGPSSGRSTQVSIVNGAMTSSSVLTFSWQLLPAREGTLEVPAFTFDVDGQRIQVDRAVVEVGGAPPITGPGTASPGISPPGPAAPSPRRPRARAEGSSPWEGPRRASSDRLDVRAIVDDDDVWLGQEIVVTHVLDFQASGITYGPTVPAEFPGFAKTAREVNSKGRLLQDPTSGETFQRAPLARWALVPLATGRKVLPAQPYSFDVRPAGDFFSIFGGAPRRATRSTPAIEINVRPLPAGAPASFRGAVGAFQLETRLDATSVKQGDGATLLVTVKGKGAFQGIAPPELTMPSGLRLFEPEVTEEIAADEDGHAQGHRTFAFPILVTEPGRHAIPEFEWSFFDPRTGRYVTRRSIPLQIEAAPADETVASTVNASPSASLEVKGTDIHHVRTALGSQRPPVGAPVVPRWAWVAMAAGPALTLLLACGRFARRLRRTDAATRRLQGASRRARERLKEGQAAALAGRGPEAADAAARVVAGFVADRLLLPVAELSPSEAGRAVSVRLGADLGARVEAFLDLCAVARFAAGAGGAPADDPRTLITSAERLLDDLAALRPMEEAA